MRSWWKGINWRTFAACLALATTVWLLNTVGEKRAVTFTFSIEPTGEQGRWAAFPNPQISARVELTVQDWIGFSWFGDRGALLLDVGHLSEGVQGVSSDPLRGPIVRRLGSSARVLSLTPALIEVELESISTASLEVRAAFDGAAFSERALIESPVCSPNMVAVTGRTGAMDGLAFLSTEWLDFSTFSGDSATLKLVLPRGVSAERDSVDLHWRSSKWVRYELDLGVILRDSVAGMDLPLEGYHVLPGRVHLTYFYPKDLPEPRASEFEMVGLVPSGSGLWELALPVRPEWARDPILQPGRIEVHRRISR